MSDLDPKPECSRCDNKGYIHCGDNNTGMSYRCDSFGHKLLCPVLEWSERQTIRRDILRLQEENERMRKVVDAAKKWDKERDDPDSGSAWELHEAVEEYEK